MNNTVLKHQGVIHKRWSSKAVAKRHALLREVWAVIPEIHRPEFTTEGLLDVSSHVQTKPELLWPFLNLEDLTDPKHLFALLVGRALKHPSAFAMSELEYTTIFHDNSRNTLRLPRHRVQLVREAEGTSTAGGYGSIVELPSKQALTLWDRRKYGHRTMEGIYVLMIQDKIYNFLNGCCAFLLRDLVETPTSSSSLSQQPQHAPRPLLDQTSSNDFEMMARRQPFEPPSETNHARIQRLAESGYMAAKDHI